MTTDTEHVVFVGGPFDGEHGTVPAGRDRWVRLVPPSYSAFDLSTPPELTPSHLETVAYRQLRDDTGMPSRRDDGRLVYVLDGPVARALEGCRFLVDPDGLGDGRVLVLCRCGVALVCRDAEVAQDIRIRHAADPTYGRSR